MWNTFSTAETRLAIITPSPYIVIDYGLPIYSLYGSEGMRTIQGSTEFVFYKMPLFFN
jgi:hypothetical protein